MIKENGKSVTTIIQKFVKDCDDHLDKKEKKTSKLWADSALRFYEVSDIKKGSGYTITDVFDNLENSFSCLIDPLLLQLANMIYFILGFTV